MLLTEDKAHDYSPEGDVKTNVTGQSQQYCHAPGENLQLDVLLNLWEDS